MSISLNDLTGTINSGFKFGGGSFQIGYIIHTSNNLINYTSNTSNTLSDLIKNSTNASSTNSNNFNISISNISNSLFNNASSNSNNLFNYSSNTSNILTSNINNNILTSINNNSNILTSNLNNTSNTLFNISFTNSNTITSNINNNILTSINNNSNILTSNLNNTSNTLNNKFNSINTDTIIQGTSNRFIVNDIYNRNITFTNTIFSSNVTTSNLNVIGDTTTLNTTIYQTEQLQVVNDTTSTAMIVKQVNSNKNVAEFYYQNNLLGLVLNSNGNVGVGITNPLNKFDINGKINTTGLLISDSITGTNPLYISSPSTTANNCINIKNNSTYNAYIGIGGTAFGGNYANNFFIESVTSSIILNTNGRTTGSVPNLIVHSSGNVGIGTTNPTCLLTLGSSASYKVLSLWDNPTPNNFQFVGFGNNSGLCFNTNTSSDAFQFRVGASTTTANELMRINGNGSVCIGTATATSTNTKLTISGSSSGYSQPLVNITQTSGSWDGNYALQVTGYTNLGGFRINGADGQSIYHTTLNSSMSFALNSLNTSGNITFMTYGSGGNIIFYTNGANERLKIDNNGLITTSGNIDCGGGISITGSTAFFANSLVDAGNLPNTFINFKYAGSDNDWCYLRQIGGANEYKMALDFHDDGTEARFCIRSIQSTANPDNITEVFTVDNGNVYCTGNMGVGTNAPPVKFYVSGDIASTGDITAYYSDIRLKDIHSNIKNPLDIINNLNGFYYTPNELAKSFGINKNKMEIGLSAQDVQKVLPELVNIAPFDMILDEDGKIISKSGDNYLTISYERLVPILIEGIKEQNKKISNLENEINKIKDLLKL